MTYLPDLIVLAVALYFAWDLYRAYKAAIGSTSQRVGAAFKGAAKSAWTGFTVAVSAIIGMLAQLADFVNAPSVANSLTTWGKPSIVAGIMIASAVILEYAKRRNVS